MRKSLSIGLLLLVFLGTVGVPLYRHTCLHDKVTINTLFMSSDHCDPEHEQQEMQHEDCCKPVAETVVEDGCCSESMSMLAISFNFFEHVQLTPLLAPELVKNAAYYLSFVPETVEKERLLAFSNTDPPKPGGKELLTRICIWRI